MEMIKAGYGDLPCGVIYISGGAKPSVTFINREMQSFLSDEEEAEKWIRFIRENILLAIPTGDRNQFMMYLEKALSDGTPFRIRHKMVGVNGKEIRFSGWMQGVETEKGEKEIRVVYAPPGYIEEQITRHEQVYREALKRYYDVIFDVDLETRVVDCMHSKNVKNYGFMPIVRYTYDGAFDYLIGSYIYEEDREMVIRFRDEVFEKKGGFDADVKSTRFRVKHRDFPVITMDCDVLGIDEWRCLICFKDVTEEIRTGVIPEENVPSGDSRVLIRCGDTFDVFVEGKPIAFRNEKSKELLKIMVEKRGGYVGATHAIRLLWPGEESTKTVQSRYRQTALRLNNTLKEYGVEDIIENKAGQRRIIPEKVLIES
ncbi:MAG: hypothetical protein MJ059_06815 [Lachnospiraceae bacterium]|nr:hypothetical protein [Lachnospiraceae bacterium]